MSAQVLAVHLSPHHAFSKITAGTVRLVAGVGVEGDAHSGVTVKHRSRVVRDPTQPNLRQVHLLHVELLQELEAKGFSVSPGDIGENLTSQGIDLLALPQGARLHIGAGAVVEVTGLRNPCSQLEAFRPGLMEAVLERTPTASSSGRPGSWGWCGSVDWCPQEMSSGCVCLRARRCH